MCETVPEVPVIVSVVDFDFTLPEQPATTAKTSIAAARPRRVRARRVIGITNRSIIAIAAKTICLMEKGGIEFGEVTGTTLLAPVTVTVTLPPGLAEDGLTAQVAMLVWALVHDTATEPVNPPRPLTATGNVAVLPRITPWLAGAVRLKSQTVPETLMDCGDWEHTKFFNQAAGQGNYRVSAGIVYHFGQK